MPKDVPSKRVFSWKQHWISQGDGGGGYHHTQEGRIDGTE